MYIKVEGTQVTDTGIIEILRRARLVPAGGNHATVELSPNVALRGLDPDHNGVFNGTDFRRIFGVESSRASSLWGSYKRTIEFLQHRISAPRSVLVLDHPGFVPRVTIDRVANIATLVVEDFFIGDTERAVFENPPARIARLDIDWLEVSSMPVREDRILQFSIPAEILPPGEHLLRVRLGIPGSDAWRSREVRFWVSPVAPPLVSGQVRPARDSSFTFRREPVGIHLTSDQQTQAVLQVGPIRELIRLGRGENTVSIGTEGLRTRFVGEVTVTPVGGQRMTLPQRITLIPR